MTLAVLSLGIIAGAIVIIQLGMSRRRSEAIAIARAVDTIRTAEYRLFHDGADKNNPGQYWTGDVAGLHQLGLIPKELAEADVAPARPLVNPHKPYHGYYFVAMESGLNHSAGEPVSLKGLVRSKVEYAFCAYPADEEDPMKPTYILGSQGLWKTSFPGIRRVVQWPAAPQFQDRWARVD